MENLATTSIAPDRVFAALGNGLRWQIVLRLADGQALAATAVAQEFGRDFDGISKHLRQLRSAGVLASRRGDDRRVELYYLPESTLATPGCLDFGCCRISLAGLAPLAPIPPVVRKSREKLKPATPEPQQKPAPAIERTSERPKVGFDDDERDDEGGDFVPQGFGEMLARTGSLPLALGGRMPRREPDFRP